MDKRRLTRIECITKMAVFGAGKIEADNIGELANLGVTISTIGGTNTPNNWRDRAGGWAFAADAGAGDAEATAAAGWASAAHVCGGRRLRQPRHASGRRAGRPGRARTGRAGCVGGDR